MKVLLSAYIGGYNLGDEAIAQVVVKQLAGDPDMELTVLSRRPRKTADDIRGTHARVMANTYPCFLRALRQSDCLVLGGGGIIQDESSVLNLLYYYLQALHATLLGLPVILYFVGVGPITTSLGRFLMRDLATRVTHAIVRDQESHDLLVAFGFKPANITTAYDVAFDLRGDSVLAGKVAPYLLFCPRDWFFTTRALPTRYALALARTRRTSRLHTYRRSLLALVTRLLTDDPRLVVVAAPFFFTQDYALIAWISERLPAPLAGRFRTIDRELTTDDAIELAAHARAVLGGRLHSLVIGAALLRPMAPLIYSAKVESLVKYLRLEAYASTLTHPDLNVPEVAARVKLAMHHSQVPYAADLPRIRQRNSAAARRALELVKRVARRG